MSPSTVNPYYNITGNGRVVSAGPKCPKFTDFNIKFQLQLSSPQPTPNPTPLETAGFISVDAGGLISELDKQHK